MNDVTRKRTKQKSDRNCFTKSSFPRFLPPPSADHIQQDREHHAYQQRGRQRKVHRRTFPAIQEVSRQTPQRPIHPPQQHHRQTRHYQGNSKKNQQFPKLHPVNSSHQRVSSRLVRGPGAYYAFRSFHPQPHKPAFQPVPQAMCAQAFSPCSGPENLVSTVISSPPEPPFSATMSVLNLRFQFSALRPCSHSEGTRYEDPLTRNASLDRCTRIRTPRIRDRKFDFERATRGILESLSCA